MPATATPESAAKNTVARRKAAAPKATTTKTTVTKTKENNVPATKTSTAKKTTTRRTTAKKSTIPAAPTTVPMSLTKMPKGEGGVRFDAPTKDLAMTTVYVKQDVWKALGEPEAIEVTVAAK